MADLCDCVCGSGFHFYLSPVRRSICHESSPRSITVSTQFGGYVYSTCVYFSHLRVIWTHNPIVALAASFLSHAQVSSAYRLSGSFNLCSWSCPLLPSPILEIPILQCETCGLKYTSKPLQDFWLCCFEAAVEAKACQGYGHVTMLSMVGRLKHVLLKTSVFERTFAKNHGLSFSLIS